MEVTEAAPIVRVTPKGMRFRARLIEGERWGSSAFYPREVIERDGPSVFSVGTPVYFDHPGRTERSDRPERSVRDLAGKIASIPVYEADNPEGEGLYAEVQAYSWAGPIMAEMADDVGMSIRAEATASTGTRMGRRGPVVESLTKGISVDVVTKAGAGGKLLSLIESAHDNPEIEVVTAEVEIDETAASDFERSLRDAVRAAYADTDTYVWMKDYDPDRRVAWYSVETGGETALWEESYTLDATGTPALSGTRHQVTERTVYAPLVAHAPSFTAAVVNAGADPAAVSEAAPTNVPVPAGQPNPNPNPEEHLMGMIQVDEAQHASLTEVAGRVPALTTERDQATRRADVAESDRDRYRDRDAARDVIDATEGASSLTPLERRGLLAELPRTEAGAFDRDAFGTAVSEAVAERKRITEAAGRGRITGLGEVAESDTDNAITWDDIPGFAKGA